MDSANENILGVRLKLARKMAGLSLQELSNKLSNIVTKQSLNKYEQGSMRPTNEVILALSKTLNVKPDYFLKKSSIELNDISFRKKVTLSKKIEESIIEKARDYVERFLEVENILGIDSVFNNPLKNIQIKDSDDVEKTSLKLRETWELGLNPIPNIVEMLEMNGIKVYLIDEVDDIDGISFVASKNIPVVIVNTRNKSNERIRFTIIHELAHLLLSFNEEVKNENKIIEKLCHKFSSCFLIPSDRLIKMIGGSHRNYIAINELITIKEYFGISIRAIVHRLQEMNIITKSYYQRWMIYMSKTYGQKEEPGNYINEEKAKIFDRLVSRALSEEIISISKAASLLNTSVNNIRKGIVGV